jgi:hypothetical protein
MEVAVLASLLGLGYVVSQIGDKKKAVIPTNTNSNNSRKVSEGFIPAARGPSTDALQQAPQGGAATGFSPELDQMYKYPNGQLYPSEPNPGPHGSVLGYASQKPPVLPDSAKLGGTPLSSNQPEPQPIDCNVPMMEMRVDGVETNASYVNTKYVTSPLSGQQIPAEEYRHNNMQPFFGGRMKQNISPQMNQQTLDFYTGSGSTQIAKREVENMFETSRAPFGNPFGMENHTEFMKSRIVDPNVRNGERPMEQVQVAPGVGEEYGFLGKGGFQQLEVNDIMRGAYKTNITRTADNPQTTFQGVMVPGSHFVTTQPDSNTYGEVRKYKPDTFFINQGAERFLTTTGEYIGETARSVQVMPFTSRSETASELIGTPASTDYTGNYVSGAYRTPMAQQYSGAGFRNADMQTYYTKDIDGTEADYGRSSYENKPNERELTSERVMGLNLVPAEAGLVTAHPADDARPTRRAETVGNPRLSGTPTIYDNKAPAITVWDPQDVARTTVKEGTIYLDRPGIAASGSAPNRLQVYDPDDIARPTQKQQLSNHNWTGPGLSASKDGMDTTFAYNMRSNPNKEQIARGRRPIAGSGKLSVFTGEIHQSTKRLDGDSINDRPNAVNRVGWELSPGVGDIGRMEYRVPLNLDVSRDRNTYDSVQSVDTNPLMQSLQRNAAHDAAILAKMSGIVA